jgi:hypothetical protein
MKSGRTSLTDETALSFLLNKVLPIITASLMFLEKEKKLNVARKYLGHEVH